MFQAVWKAARRLGAFGRLPSALPAFFHKLNKAGMTQGIKSSQAGPRDALRSWGPASAAAAYRLLSAPSTQVHWMARIICLQLKQNFIL